MTLTVNQLPSHTHPLQVTNNIGTVPNPETNVAGTGTTLDAYINEQPFEPLSSQAVSNVGGSRSHTNLMPYLCIHFIIALVGIYPSRH